MIAIYEGYRARITSMTLNIGGVVEPGWEPVREAFIANFTGGEDVGAGVAVYHRGHRVVDLTGGLFVDGSERRSVGFADPDAYADKYHLEGKHKKLLVDFDAPGIVASGVHPLLIFLVRMHVERERGKTV